MAERNVIKSWTINKAKLLSGLYLTLFCVAIAVLLFGLGVTNPFHETLAISLSIGWSIQGTNHFLGPMLTRRFSLVTTMVLLAPIGLSLGLGIAGLLNHGDIRAYFLNNYVALVLGIFFTVVGYLIFEGRDRLSKTQAQLAEAVIRQEQQEKELLVSELKLLQAQIEPHFLFNTLSNIISLVHHDPNNAEKALLNLTTLLRSSLDRTRQQFGSLGEELLMIQAYLEIQSIRMPDRLSYAFNPPLADLPSALADFQIPPLLVQPLVENAIQHGIDPLTAGGKVTISVAESDEYVTIEVADTGKGVSSSGPKGLGTGVSNVRSRLAALFTDAAELELKPNRPSGVRATLSIPRQAK